MKNILIFAISMILASCSVPVNKPKVINGTLDLRNWNLQENGTVQLDGEWEFYWEKFLKPGEIISGSPEYLKVPGLWNGFKRNGSTVGNLGFATYRLKILLNPAEKKLAVRLPSISSSYELFINGDSIFSAGKPGRSRSEMIPEYKPQYIDIPVTSDALVFIFNVSNFQHTKGGLWKSIQIGAKEDIRSSRRRHLFTDLFLSGSLFIMGLYHIGLFILRKKSISPLLFGIFCMLMIFRIGLTEEMYFKEYFGNFPWEWQLRIEYLDFIFSVPAAFYFIGTLYKEEFKKAIGYLVLGICILNALIVIFTDTLLFTQTLIYFQVFIFVTSLTGIFMIIRAIINKREGAIIFLLGFLILVATIINDILYNNNLSNFAGLYPVGFFIFIFFQAFLLSKIFSRALSTVETLSADLEAQVVERTKELTVEKEIALNALQAKSQFLSVMSHEIRTPLNGVIGIAQVFSNENLSAQQKDLLSKLKFSAETLLLLINDVLDFSKIEEGKIEFEKVAFNLKGLLENISGIFSSKIEEKKNALLIDISPQIPEMLIGDSHRLSQILINLIGNSAKFTSSGKIIVSAIVESSTSETVQIRFEVSDTGIGIEYSDKEKIFEKFTQANLQVSRNFGGTGLGLAIVKRLLELQGSRIDFTSEPGKGSKFFFVLQFDTKIGSGESIDKSVQNESRGIDLKGLIILVVDDNDINILLAKRLLEKAGIVVESALNGESAIEKFRAGKFDFVLMDVHMPGMDGFETTVEIRKIMQERNEDVPVIALSADITPEVKRDAEKSGMKDYLTKPFEQKALYAKIEQYLMKK